MKDECLTYSFPLQQESWEKPYIVDVYAIFDGERSNAAALYAREHFGLIFHETVEQLRKKSPAFGMNTDLGRWTALKVAFIRLKELCKACSLEETTATVAVVFNHHAIWTASTGNSRAIFSGSKHENVQLSVDDMDSGSQDSERPIRTRPRITSFYLDRVPGGRHSEGAHYLILGNKGIWQAASPCQVGNAVCIDKADKKPKELAKNLVYSAHQINPSVGQTAMVIKL